MITHAKRPLTGFESLIGLPRLYASYHSFGVKLEEFLQQLFAL